MERKECIIEKADQDKLVEKSYAYRTHLGEAVAIMLDTGCHISVICKPRKWKVKLTPDTKILTWKRPKSKRFVSVVVTDRIRPFIRDFLVNPNNKRYHRSYYNRMLSEVAKDVSPSTLRHTFIFNKAVQDYTIPEVAAMCGASFRTLERFYLLLKQYRNLEGKP